MLNGTSPVIIFHMLDLPASAEQFIKGIPKVGEFLARNVGIPIPIYLDERISGILVQGQTHSIDMDTKVEGENAGKKTITFQKPVNNIVTVNMVADKSSLLLMVLLAFSDQIFQRVVAKSYGITYLNGPITVFGGLLHRIATEDDADNTKIQITLELAKASLVDTTLPNPTPVIPFTTGVLP